MNGDHSHIRKLIQRVYNLSVRPYLPWKIAVLNGIPVRARRLFDSNDVDPTHEAALLEAVRNETSEGDHVVVVGGGFGVSTIAAAERAASVVTYEASEEHVELIRESVEINGVTNVTVEHAIVGSAIHTFGDMGSPREVSPTDLPDCDVLELDCEGAELGILRNLSIRPRIIVVETHANFDSPEAEVRRELDQLGYEVVSRGVENQRNGVFILAAHRR
jgi:hypothetical protein